MNDSSKVTILLAVQLQRWVEFVERHLEEMSLTDDEEMDIRHMKHTYYESLKRFGPEFHREVDQALFDMIGGYMKI